MRLYEIFVILHPRLSEEEVNSFATTLEKQLTAHTPGSAVTGRKVEQDQSLSYPLAHQLRGHFLHLELEVSSEEEVSDEVHRDMQLEEDVLRYLVFRKPKRDEKPAQETVIERMRSRQEGKTQSSATSTVKARDEKKEAVDESEVDKKIEELLS